MTKRHRYDFGMRGLKGAPMRGASILESVYSILGPKRQPGFVKKAVRKTHRLEENKRRRRERLQGKQELQQEDED